MRRAGVEGRGRGPVEDAHPRVRPQWRGALGRSPRRREAQVRAGTSRGAGVSPRVPREGRTCHPSPCPRGARAPGPRRCATRAASPAPPAPRAWARSVPGTEASAGPAGPPSGLSGEQCHPGHQRDAPGRQRRTRERAGAAVLGLVVYLFTLTISPKIFQRRHHLGI